MVFQISTGVFVVFMLGVGLLFAGILHLVYRFGNKRELCMAKRI
jgi:uncharacterized membrane protein HdeD (DUF308 family)